MYPAACKLAFRRTERRKNDLDQGVDGSCYVERCRKYVDGQHPCCLAPAHCTQDEGVDFQEGRARCLVEPGMVGSRVLRSQNMGHVELLYRLGQVLQGPLLLLVFPGNERRNNRGVSTIVATTCQEIPFLLFCQG